MQLDTLRLVNGPSLFSAVPCIVATLVSSEKEQDGNAAYTQAAQDWPSIVPALQAIAAGDRHGLAGAARLIEALTAHLLVRVGLPADDLAIRHDTADNRVCIAVPQQNVQLTAEITARACRYALHLFNHGISAEAKRELHTLLANADALSKKAAITDMQRHLQHGSIPWLALDQHSDDRDLIQLGFGCQQRLLSGTTTMGSSHVGISLSLSKRQTLTTLEQAGFPVPTQVVVKNLADATDQARRIGYPVVLKAEHGTKGERVFADLRNDEELARSFAELRSLLSNYRMKIRILVEKHIEGNVYRMEVVGGRFFDAYHMIPAAVTGDGIHSIRELIAAENDHPSRKDQGFIKARYRPLRLGSAENLMLQKQALSADSVPEAGQHVRLSANSNWSAGGTFKRLGDAAHPDNIRLTDTIAAMLGIDIAGIDLISKDIGKSFMEEPLTFIEVNHSPYIASFTDDRTGETLDNGPRLLERLASGLAYGDVPVILVTESPQAGTIAEAISGLLVDEGRRPGRIVDNHVQVNGLPAGVVHSYIADDPALLLLRRPDVGSVIVQRDLARMADSGIGSGGCDIAVVTDTAMRPLSSPVWAQGINSDTVKRLLAKYSRTGVVLCVDDVDAAKRSESIAGQRCVFVTSDPAAATFLRESGKTVLSTDEQHINQSAHKSLQGLKAGLVVQAVKLLLDQIHKG